MRQQVYKKWLRASGRILVLLSVICIAWSASAQTISISGTVRDEAGEPLVGVSVVEKGTTNGTNTDVNGAYKISAKSDATLVYTFLGMATQEILVGGRAHIDVRMLEASAEIEEVVVTAFGTGQKKETMTGAVQSIRPTDLIVPASNLSNAFAGRLAGMISYQRSGEPGKNGSDFYIRGIATLSGVTKPLVILDGVEIDSEV